MRMLITGASRGIGAEMAAQAVARGDEVVAVVRHFGAAVPAGAERRVADVTDAAALAGLARSLADAPPLDLLVCNAGIYEGRGRIGETAFPADAWARTFAANVAGVFLTVEALLPLIRAPGGRIAVISSRMGSNTASRSGGSYIYRASKAAATNLATNLALDLADRGVSVGAYHPGWVRTDMGSQAADISVEQSAAGLLARFDALGPETTGVFESFDGAPLAY
ncbi:MAG: SDR family NAD(P)-dependent oxidoreductase [Pseudomonadota bacterium]